MYLHLRSVILCVAAALLALPILAGDTKTRGDFGTSVRFEKSPKAAATKALKEEKLVMVLHISGLFEEPDYT